MWNEYHDLMRDTVTVQKKSGFGDAYGDVPLWGAPKGLRARVVRKNRLTRRTDGQVVTSTTQAYVDPDGVELNSTDLITLSDGSTPEVLSVNKVPDDLGRTAVRIDFA